MKMICFQKTQLLLFEKYYLSINK